MPNRGAPHDCDQIRLRLDAGKLVPQDTAALWSDSCSREEAIVRSVASVEIDRRIEDVYRLTTEHVAEWSIVVIDEEVLEETYDGVGTTFRTVTEDRGQRMEFLGVVTRQDPPYLHAIQMTGAMFDIETEFTFDDLSGSTCVTQVADVTGKGAFKLFLICFGWLMTRSSNKASQNELESLKAFCEAPDAPR